MSPPPTPEQTSWKHLRVRLRRLLQANRAYLSGTLTIEDAAGDKHTRHQSKVSIHEMDEEDACFRVP
jgi:hypothetical protein